MPNRTDEMETEEKKKEEAVMAVVVADAMERRNADKSAKMMERSLQDRERAGVPDAVLLEDFTNKDVFVENLKKRFNENIIYTYIGPVLVSVNPYREVNIYTKKEVDEYQKKHFFEAPPHVFALTDTAYRSLLAEKREQCILISGESGAGKTECSKKVLLYIAEVTDKKGQVEIVKNKLVQSNPVLEAFGNAKTNRNDNSSRFGKYMDIEFNFEGNPIGGNILNYLLEKSRVINQISGERNFHIFYQLIAGSEDSCLEKLHLKKDLDSYYYLSHGSKSNTSDIEDKRCFQDVTKALATIEIDDEEKANIFKIVASVLHLGNIGFIEDEGKADLNKTDSIEYVCELLGCNLEDMKKALTHRTRLAKGDVLVSPLNRETAIYARDALAKAIYDRLFTWLVKRINKSIQSNEVRKNPVIGILDIYGFEIFDTNSFEQLCINFCNEKLQQLFIELTLKSEQEEYLKEGIEWKNIEYFDNRVICDLIEEKHKGIIALMDEECLRPGEPTDLTLLQKMNAILKQHLHYNGHEQVDRVMQKRMTREEFQLIHYAGSVTYCVRGFIEKNNDLLFRDLRETMAKSSNGIVQSIFPAEEQMSKKRPNTAITQFKNSLNDLMKILMTKEPNYIRCIKPNDSKQSGTFDNRLVSHQVTYLGLMENLRVRRAGFAYRRTYETFLQRYKCLCKETWPNYKGTPKDGVQALINHLGYDKEDYRMGKTKIFIRFPKTLFETEDAYQAKRHEIASLIQAKFKGILQRRRYLKMRWSVIMVQKCARRWRAMKQLRRRKEAVQTIRRFIEGFITRNGPATNLNKSFVELAKKQWLLRLAKSLPKSLLENQWPKCPYTCQEASELLRHHHRLHLSRMYRKKLSPEMKEQLDLKVLAEKLFQINGQKKSYRASIPQLFKNERIPQEVEVMYQNFVKTLNGEKIQYATTTVKYDRHGYKPRDRLVIATTQNIYILEAKGSSANQKHKLPLENVSLLVTSEKDKMLMIVLPEMLIKKDKGDLILQIPHVIECVTKIVNIKKNAAMLKVVDKKTIEHNMIGKQGIIDVRLGNPEGFQKDKTGHLLITASP